MNVNPWLLAAPLFPLAMIGAAIVLLRLHQRQQALDARISSVLHPGGPQEVVISRGIMRQDVDKAATWQDHAGTVFGFSPARADQYPVGWPWVILLCGLFTGVVAVLAAGLVGPWPARLGMIVAWILLTRTVFARSDAKRKSKLMAQFPDTLGLIVRAVRVGIPVTEALRAVADEAPEPTRTEFNRVADQIGIGTAPEQALRELATRNELPEYSFFAATLTLQAQTGGGLTETLDLLADVIRKRVAVKARGYALSAEARTSSLVLGVMPIATGLLITALNPEYMAVLFFDRTGNLLLGAAVLSLAVGTFLMQTIIRKSLG